MAAQGINLCETLDTDINLTQAQHTIGNMGRPGMSLLMSQSSPLAYEFDRGTWQFIKHKPFESQLGSNFTGTSPHLSFTGCESS